MKSKVQSIQIEKKTLKINSFLVVYIVCIYAYYIVNLQ